jgi:hypothetical protein
MGDRALRLANDLKVSTLSGAARALADEAVLITERLEQLDATLKGAPDAWLSIVVLMPATVAEVDVCKPLAEVRQQGLALKAVLAELRAQLGKADAPAAPSSVSDELKAQRDLRRKGVAG